MRVLIQRVKTGSVIIDHQMIAKIGRGLVILVGIASEDRVEYAEYLAEKIANLRIFEDADGKMNKSVIDIRGEALVISQFTLYADSSRGRRPSFTDAARPDIAAPMVEYFIKLLIEQGVRTLTGEFGAHMLVDIANDGPVTIWLERK
jgi:D-tyrosyl-tRNA(Tyr) deacylase